MTDDIRRSLRDAYDHRADVREARPPPVWESAERDAFLTRLLQERKRSVLELGAATGTAGVVFHAHGLDIVCVDLSPEMVRRCRGKGLPAHVMDVADLRFDAASFEAVYAMNCLVHVPKAELSAVLSEIRRVLTPGGLFYLGLYGGYEYEGVWDNHSYEPKRFFAHYPDEDLQRLVTAFFDLLSFQRIPHGWDGLHFQSLVLRTPPAVDGGN